ncbi:molybdate transport system regulatory protein [Pollutimonas bauzanensis]|uniref:Molybdate transport system regulatory protein n=2 Tax=Pollutimonas bauzanensis TaxID=658167 RepID=A0A1M5VZB6_9BURK|nr:molybdate transport system regulatory protein [Pollutimonas bauzanensis]
MAIASPVHPLTLPRFSCDASMKTKIQFRLRVYQDDSIAIGPGKVALLEAIAETGSISAAARQFNMSYRRAWLLIDQMNRALSQPAVATATGGAHGGGTRLTPVGEDIIKHYRAIESTSRIAAAEDIAALTRLLAP